MSALFTLQTLIGAHQPLNDAEAYHKFMILHVLENTKCPLHRQQFAPGHLTASAWVVNPARTHTLLMQHPHTGIWHMPGGHADGDANLLSVAVKEVGEEAGWLPKDLELWEGGRIFDVDAHVVPPREKNGVHEPEHVHFDIRHLFISRQHALPESPEGIPMRWATFNEAKANYTADGGHYRCIEKLHTLFI